MNRCELTWLPRQKIDVARAIEQHRAYERCLADLGVRVISLPEQPELPDSVFVEDPLIVVDEMAVVAPMGCESRRAESESLAAAVAPFVPCAGCASRQNSKAAMSCGSATRCSLVCRAEPTKRESPASRTNSAPSAIAWFRSRSAAACISNRLVVPWATASSCANRAWLDTGPLHRFRILDVALEEPHAANVLRIGGTVIMPAAFPLTERMLRSEGFNVARSISPN